MKRGLVALVALLERFRMWLFERPFFISTLLPLLPRRLRWALRRAYLAPIDVLDRLLGRHDPSLPAKSSVFTGAVHDFNESGRLLLAALEETAGLTPSSHVLDVGCGIGRLAIPLAEFLSADGSYEGIDIVPDGIEWCQANVSGPHGNVRFTLADVFNTEYHPAGQMRAADYVFPYEDERFDVVVLISVFTHMLPDEVDNYLGEIARVLKPGGRCFISYFLLAPGGEPPRSAKVHLRHHLGDYSVTSLKSPELCVGYRESFIRRLYDAHGFVADPVLFHGRWSGREGHWPADSGLGDQDTFVATKLGAPVDAEVRLVDAASGE